MEWNDAIAEYFFNEDNAHREVYLCFTRRDMETIARNSFGIDNIQDAEDNFRAALKGLPDRGGEWEHARYGDADHNIWERAYRYWGRPNNWPDVEGFTKWREVRDPGDDYPPYIAFLAFGVFVLTERGGHGLEYYGHLSYFLETWFGLDPLPERGQRHPPYFPQTESLWNDLREWSCEDRAGELGQLRTIYAGGWVERYREQALFRRRDGELLKQAFIERNIQPAIRIPELDLYSRISECIRRGVANLRFGPRLRGLGERARRGAMLRRDDHRKILINQIDLRLHTWDGHPPDLEQFGVGAEEDAPRRVPAVLGITGDFPRFEDALKGDIELTDFTLELRLRWPERVFPADGICIPDPAYGVEDFRCYQESGNFSDRIERDTSGELFPLEQEINDGFEELPGTAEGEGEQEDIRINLKGMQNGYRIFKEGGIEDLTCNFIEGAPESGSVGLLFYRTNDGNIPFRVNRFLDTCFGNHMRVSAPIRDEDGNIIGSKIPDGFAISIGRRNAAQPDGEMWLGTTLNTVARLEQIGGIRHGEGLAPFFSFGLPTYVVNGGQGQDVRVEVNGMELEQRENEGAWHITDQHIEGQALPVELDVVMTIPIEGDGEDPRMVRRIQVNDAVDWNRARIVGFVNFQGIFEEVENDA